MMTTTIRHRAHRRHPPRGVPDGYRAMADREALKVMIKP